MGYQYFKRPIRADLSTGSASSVGRLRVASGLVERVETVNSTATTLSANGLSILGAGGSTTDKVYKLAAPAISGVHKYIVCNATGAQKVSVVNAATANTFMETTSGTLVFSTNSTKQRSCHLIAVSTAKWHIVARSTGTTLAG